jgi:hypothetical protein
MSLIYDRGRRAATLQPSPKENGLRGPIRGPGARYCSQANPWNCFSDYCPDEQTRATAAAPGVPAVAVVATGQPVLPWANDGSGAVGAGAVGSVALQPARSSTPASSAKGLIIWSPPEIRMVAWRGVKNGQGVPSNAGPKLGRRRLASKKLGYLTQYQLLLGARTSSLRRGPGSPPHRRAAGAACSTEFRSSDAPSLMCRN